MDGGDEYNAIEFLKFCKENGIEHEVVFSYTPHYNGLDERRNITLLYMSRSMLKEKNLHHTLWGEVVATSAYMLNSGPTKKMEEIVPLEKWTKDKQSVTHLRVFGFVCYKHVPDAKRKKMDDRNKVMLLVGTILQVLISFIVQSPIRWK